MRNTDGGPNATQAGHAFLLGTARDGVHFFEHGPIGLILLFVLVSLAGNRGGHDNSENEKTLESHTASLACIWAQFDLQPSSCPEPNDCTNTKSPNTRRIGRPVHGLPTWSALEYY